jgi:hypothetical protein
MNLGTPRGIPLCCNQLVQTNYRKQSASLYLEVAFQCQHFFPAREIPEMLQVFLPLLTFNVSDRVWDQTQWLIPKFRQF